MRKYYYIASVLLVTILSCLHPVSEHEISTAYFLEAYLFDGQPVQGILVKELLYFKSVDEYLTDPVINQESHVKHAAVTLNTTDTVYTLERDSNSTDSTYACAHVVEAGKEYRIEVSILDSTGTEKERLSAITTIPMRDNTLFLNKDTLLVDSLAIKGKRIDMLINPEKYPHLTVTINTGTQKYHIFDFQCLIPTDLLFPDLLIVTPPFQSPFKGNIGYIYIADFIEYGYYMASVYHVNKEYADLYYENDNPEFSINTDLYPEAISNVENGNGIFTGVSCDTIYFTIAPEPL